MSESMPEVFMRAVDLMTALGFTKINLLPACAEHQVDEQWWIAFNGHGMNTKCSRGPEVPPYSLYVEFNGWPAGVIDAGGGTIAAGEIANEETFLAALTSATKEKADA